MFHAGALIIALPVHITPLRSAVAHPACVDVAAGSVDVAQRLPCAAAAVRRSTRTQIERIFASLVQPVRVERSHRDASLRWRTGSLACQGQPSRLSSLREGDQAKGRARLDACLDRQKCLSSRKQILARTGNARSLTSYQLPRLREYLPQRDGVAAPVEDRHSCLSGAGVEPAQLCFVMKGEGQARRLSGQAGLPILHSHRATMRFGGGLVTQGIMAMASTTMRDPSRSFAPMVVRAGGSTGKQRLNAWSISANSPRSPR